jgi:MscS family membrane protein
LGDEVIRVGDTCQFGDRVGTVEDISLRSTRIRTAERTELSIPNGALAAMNVENLSRRDKLLFKAALGLRPETSADQLRFVLAEVRRMLYEHPKVETSSARIRLVSIAQGSFNLEAFAYILTQDFNEFAAIQEDLLFRIMAIVDQAGSAFAFPSRTIYLARDSALNEEKSEAAVQQVH